MNASSRSDRRAFLHRSALLAGLSLVPGQLAHASAAPATPLNANPKLEDIVTLADAEEAARAVTPGDFFDFIQGGAGDEITLRWNQEKYREIRLRPRVLADLGQLDTRTRLFGSDMACPILFAPTSSNRILHPEGELAVARAASTTGTTYVLSTLANTAVEEVVKATQSPLWFQVYVQTDLELTKDLMRRAEAAGARAFCVTVDAPVPGARSREERAKFKLPPGVELPHIARRREPGQFTLDRMVPIRFTWPDVEQLIAHARMPVLLKGILTPEDAQIAMKAGAAGIIVSNHGGRQLDTVPSTIEALSGIVAAVEDRVPVLIDGGIRRGTDVVKALALGAKAVLIGRPYLHGLASGGTDGVTHVQKILLREFRMALALLGCKDLAAVNRSVLWDKAKP
jgi:4-hydroxymandelate oxidase